MSGRALRRLRQERDDLVLKGRGDEGSDEDDDESDDDEEDLPVKKKPGFAFMVDNDDDSDDSDESSSEGAKVDPPLKSEPAKPKSAPSAVEDEKDEPEEDLDAILEEFQQKDEVAEYGTDGRDEKTSSYYDIITHNIELRGLDIDFVQRTSLLGSMEDGGAPNRNRRGRQAVFGPPRDNWPRPPHYVGGGMGMTSYEAQGHDAPGIPWPYSEMKDSDERCPDLNRWFLFTYSDTYERDREDFERVKASGDPNALALYIAHHPFVIEALLQLSTVLYQTNQSNEGLSLLKRALYTFECASLNSFLQVDDRLGFMDYERRNNELFFSALFRLVRVSHVAGLPRASLAASRFLLSLDPLRDPMGVLLAIDHFALISNNETNDRWLVDFVENDKVKLHYRDETSEESYESSLLDMPNWAYSYALALYRMDLCNPTDSSQEKANSALRQALSRFPSILEQLLVQNEVNTTARSFQTDWQSVLGFVRERADQVRNALTEAAAADPVVRACTTQAYDVIARIFVQQNFKLWSINAVLVWVYNNLKELKENPDGVHALQPAIMRYARCDPSDYEDKFQTMPADANPLDPGLVAHAMTIDTNRPRFMQRMGRGGDGIPDELAMAGLNMNGGVLAGPPTEMIDPDWPIMEVFWRSFLPWAHVEGVPPPPR